MEHTELCETVKDHGERIVTLEKNEAVTSNQLGNLCKNVGGLVKAIWFLGSTIFLSLLGFFFWYVQSIPRK